MAAVVFGEQQVGQLMGTVYLDQDHGGFGELIYVEGAEEPFRTLTLPRADEIAMWTIRISLHSILLAQDFVPDIE